MAIPNNLTVQPNLAYDVDLEPTLRAIDILAEGTLFVVDIEGNLATYDFDVATLNTALPYRLSLRIQRIVGDGSGSVGNGSTGTDIAIANLVALH